MHHEMLDHFAAGRTPAHRFNPAAKTVAAVALVLTVALIGRDHFWPLAPVAVTLAAYHIISRLPVRYAAKRFLHLAPFAVAVAGLFPLLEPGRAVWSADVGPWTLRVTDAGLLRAAGLLCKFLLAAWAVLLLLSTTRFQEMLQALTRLRVPRALVVQLAFLYRYLWVMADEVMRLRMARAARDGGAGPWRLRLHSRTGLVGVLFLRTWDRAERIYWAMAARGFDGSLQTASAGHMRAADWLLALGAICGGAAILLWDHLAYA